MLVRNEEEKYWAAVRALNECVFETPTEANLVDILRDKAGPVISLVAEVDSNVVGHILFSPVSLSGHPPVINNGTRPHSSNARTATPRHRLCF